MNVYEAWQIDEMISMIKDIEQRLADCESDYEAEDFERIKGHLETARYSLHMAWLRI